MDLFKIFIGDTTWVFILEIMTRCFVMFFVIISFLRLSGKRGIRQLSIFELAIILCLGLRLAIPCLPKIFPSFML